VVKVENGDVCLVVGSGNVVGGVEYVKHQDGKLRPLLDYEELIIASNVESGACRQHNCVRRAGVKW